MQERILQSVAFPWVDLELEYAAAQNRWRGQSDGRPRKARASMKDERSQTKAKIVLAAACLYIPLRIIVDVLLWNRPYAHLVDDLDVACKILPPIADYVILRFLWVSHRRYVPCCSPVLLLILAVGLSLLFLKDIREAWYQVSWLCRFL